MTNGAPIVLSGAANEDGNASGDLDILDGGDLTIQGNGAAKTIVDGGGTDRVFHFCAGGICANTVIIHRCDHPKRHTRHRPRRRHLQCWRQDRWWMAALSAANTATYGGGIYNLATLNVTEQHHRRGRRRQPGY